MILVACKYLPDEHITALLRFPELVFGENYLQDAREKIPRERYHFIGRLQRNKIREIVKHFSVIQSVDSKKIADKISRVAEEEGLTVGVYIQVNLEKNTAHGGVSEEELDQLIAYIRTLPRIEVIGLMMVGTAGGNESLFSQLKELARKYNLKTSMGTSNDYTRAIEKGTDMVRLGRIFLAEKNST